jgi:thiosulfate dehydrogenase
VDKSRRRISASLQPRDATIGSAAKRSAEAKDKVKANDQAKAKNEVNDEDEAMTKMTGSGLFTAIAVSGLIGIAVVAASVFEQRRESADLAPAQLMATAEYGQRLVRETAALIGPDQADPAMRYTGSRLACASCHIDSGLEPGTLSLLESASRYPRNSGRDGGMRDLRDRINGCMMRSMNGRPLPRDSVEMTAIEAYIDHLGELYAAMGESRRQLKEQAAFVEPERAANPTVGSVVYADRCAKCHGDDGQGLFASDDPSDGYLFPALWGPDSFNNGAGMHRVLTAARFIKARMPFGEADLTDDEAYDVAAYINSHPRPEMSGLENDYPNRADKPVDSPYPPYADPFPQAQHQYGPFGAIRDWYAAEDSVD